jgi:competence protein ComEA
MKSITTWLAGLLLAASCWAGSPVNVNTASAEELAEALDGIGLTKAQAIVRYRESQGGFQHPDELVNVKGIGLATVDKNRDYLRFGDEAKLASSQD